jgi:hypothetical protein
LKNKQDEEQKQKEKLIEQLITEDLDYMKAL